MVALAPPTATQALLSNLGTQHGFTVDVVGTSANISWDLNSGTVTASFPGLRVIFGDGNFAVYLTDDSGQPVNSTVTAGVTDSSQISQPKLKAFVEKVVAAVATLGNDNATYTPPTPVAPPTSVAVAANGLLPDSITTA